MSRQRWKSLLILVQYFSWQDHSKLELLFRKKLNCNLLVMLCQSKGNIASPVKFIQCIVQHTFQFGITRACHIILIYIWFCCLTLRFLAQQQSNYSCCISLDFPALFLVHCTAFLASSSVSMRSNNVALGLLEDVALLFGPNLSLRTLNCALIGGGLFFQQHVGRSNP